ncbi:mechanosensitive ion channel family protein [Aliifodinibius sp. S!AR15-10]|uniref:mechanosensitive ion channel family protein n=1 Tax=Aliifodinibius sp. S!AR15-10 TaxID=2950437 RepID=UPI00285D2889|nr:mechanosensitive ion channel domain-containing protein [Aliifodinibius sp. S!AR15-10]MDR8391221.1 mechanosensitive ion channel family protein [Aliifodinibius sp. S!AR15-10]
MKKAYILFLVLFVGLSSCLIPTTVFSQDNQPDTATVQQNDTLKVEIPTSGTTSEKAEETNGDTPQKLVGQIGELISFGMVFMILLILAVTYFLNRFLIQIIDNLSEKTSKYRLAIKRSVPIVRITIWSFSLYIVIAGIIDPPFETIITVTATIGIAVGLASQDILKNIFGGFIIILDRPFQVGDKIEVGDYYGEVVQIGLRSTRIVTPDDSVVSLPNGEISSKAISNANSGALDCQVVAEIFLPADIDIDLVKRIAYKAAVSSRYVYLKKPVVVIAKNEIHEKNFVLKLRVKAYVLDIRYEFPFQSEMTELILSELNRRNLLTRSLEETA